MYDTTMLQTYRVSEYNEYFASGEYDGWSVGSLFYFEYYQFTDDSQSFGACMPGGECWGSWLIYDTSTEEYYSYFIGFVNVDTPSSLTPVVPPEYDSAYIYKFYESLRTYYMPDYSWYYLATTGSLFFRWLPAYDSDRVQLGDVVKVYTFSSVRSGAYNYLNTPTLYGSSTIGGRAETLLLSGAVIALGLSSLF